MALEETLYSRLSGYANLTALVGTRIYPRFIPQAQDMPAVCFFRVSTEPIHLMGVDGDIYTMRIQVSVFGNTLEAAKNVVAQVKAGLSRYRAGAIHDCFFENEQHFYESELERHHIILDFIVFTTDT